MNGLANLSIRDAVAWQADGEDDDGDRRSGQIRSCQARYRSWIAQAKQARKVQNGNEKGFLSFDFGDNSEISGRCLQDSDGPAGEIFCPQEGTAHTSDGQFCSVSTGSESQAEGSNPTETFCQIAGCCVGRESQLLGLVALSFRRLRVFCPGRARERQSQTHIVSPKPD